MTPKQFVLWRRLRAARSFQPGGRQFPARPPSPWTDLWPGVPLHQCPRMLTLSFNRHLLTPVTYTATYKLSLLSCLLFSFWVALYFLRPYICFYIILLPITFTHGFATKYSCSPSVLLHTFSQSSLIRWISSHWASGETQGWQLNCSFMRDL